MCFSLFSQQEIKNFMLETYKYNQKLVETDSLGQIYYFFNYKNNFELKILNSKLDIVGGKRFKLKEFNKHSSLQGIGFNVSDVFIYLYDSKNHTISRIKIDKQNIGSPSISSSIQIPETETLIDSRNINDSYHFISIDRVSNEFVIRRCQDTFDSLATTRISAHTELLAKILSGNEKKINLNHIQIYSDKIELTSSHSKLYEEKNTIYITSDNKNMCHLFKLNLIDKTCTYNPLFFHISQTNDNNIIGGNSIIKDDKLFRVTMSKNTFNTAVIDLNDFSLIKNYTFSSQSNSIDLQSSYPVEEIEFEDRADTKEYLKTPESFIEHIDPEHLAVAVADISEDEYLVQIGSSKTSYYTVTNPGYGPSFGMGSFSLGGGMGNMGNPAVYMPSSTTYLKTTKVYFKSILEKENLSKSFSENISNSIYDEVKAFENQKVNTSYKNISSIVCRENEIIYGYFSGKDDLYHLITFKTK